MELVTIENDTPSNSAQVYFTVFGDLTRTTSVPGEDDTIKTLMEPNVIGYV